MCLWPQQFICMHLQKAFYLRTCEKLLASVRLLSARLVSAAYPAHFLIYILLAVLPKKKSWLLAYLRPVVRRFFH